MNETLNSLRQTGRTTRMIHAALNAAQQKPVMVFIHKGELKHTLDHIVNPLMEKLPEGSMALRQCHFMEYDPMASGFSLQMHEFNDYPLFHEKYDLGGEVFVDHGVYEVYFSTMLDKLHAHDTVFRIGVAGVVTQR